MVFSSSAGLAEGIETAKKISETFGGANSRSDSLLKKYLEIHLALENCLYSHEMSINKSLTFKSANVLLV